MNFDFDCCPRKNIKIFGRMDFRDGLFYFRADKSKGARIVRIIQKTIYFTSETIDEKSFLRMKDDFIEESVRVLTKKKTKSVYPKTTIFLKVTA